VSFNRHRRLRCIQLALGVLFWSSCRSDELVRSEVEVRVSPLQVACATVPADVVGDVTSILASSEPVDPIRPEPYGSEQCAGVIFEFDNPDEESLHGAWIQASAGAGVIAHALSESECADRTVEADYWGYKDREWSRLGSATEAARFEPEEHSETGYCRLEALIEQAGSFEKLRIAARVTDGTDTYPMYACVW
jgi:hypothetical protein